MADTNSKIIDIEGLKVFKTNYDTVVDEKIAAAGQGVTYTLSKNSDGEIVLTGSDESVTKVTDSNTTYGFSQSGTTLTITPSTGDPITITMGEEITSAKIIAALGFTPLPDTTVIPDELADLTDDATHRLVTDTEKSTWNAKGSYSKPTGGIPKTDLAEDVQTSLGKADSAIQEHQDISGKADKATTLAGYGITDGALASEAGYDLGLSIDSSTYVMTLELKNKAGTVLSTKTLDFPIESMVVSASYKDGKLTLLLQSGETLDVDISALVSGLVNDTFTIAGIDMKDNITAAELKTALGVYSKPSDGIPSTDLASAVQTSLGKADSALQSTSTLDATKLSGTIPAGCYTDTKYSAIDNTTIDNLFK